LLAIGVSLAEYRYDPKDGIVINSIHWAHGGFGNFTYWAPRLIPLNLGILVVAVGGAWSSHALLVLFGFPNSSQSAEAADYDDARLADPSLRLDDDCEADRHVAEN
jgi:hypothetical protein